MVTTYNPNFHRSNRTLVLYFPKRFHLHIYLAVALRQKDAGNGSPWRLVGEGRKIPSKISPGLVATFVQKQLDVCLAAHNGTCKSPISGYLPKRVIKVEPDPEMMPKLVENVDEDSDYIALSHCWGSKKGPSRTLLTNLQEHKTSIMLYPDSKIIQDAIRITRALHIRYLWVDSLCIIQDDPIDWEQQSTEMTTIYANARLTISAASAHEEETGFLTNRSGPHYFKGPSASGESVTVRVREQPSHYLFKSQFNEESNLNG